MLEEPTWRKSSFSGGNDGNACVEVASRGADISLRESEIPGTVITASPRQLAALLAAVKSGALA
ncbi:DUF397 domain-containing protein [Streptomyces zagrosensis]|nr:DUF397 domain-containing protein [Streptomyces zagrosensis]